MVLKYQISAAPLRLEDMVVKIWEAQNELPGQEVWTQIIPQAIGGGHPAITTIIANGLDLVVHKVMLFGVTSGEELDNYYAEPRVDVTTIFDPIRFKIGDGGLLTPNVGDNSYTNDILEGHTENTFVVIRNDKGALHPVTHYVFDEPTRTIQLAGTDQFFNNEEFTIMLQPKSVSTLVNDSVVGKWFGGFVDVAVPTIYDPAHLRKLIRFKGTAGYDFNIDPPIGYGFVFQNLGPGAGQVGTINFNNAQLLWQSGNKDSIALPLYTEACFVFDGINWNAVYMTDASYINAGAAIQPGQIVAAGQYFVGNIPAGIQLYTITHNKNISGDYMVMFSIKGTPGTVTSDNDIGVTWWHSVGNQPNEFIMALEERVAGVQSATMCWLIIKL